MIRIAICDDEQIFIDKIKCITEKFASSNDLPVDISTYCDGDTLLKDASEFDLIFLDIEMGNVNGIEVAQGIRKINFDVPIVYVTGYSDYWRRAYKVHAFDFILKPIKENEIVKVLDDFILLMSKKYEKTITLSTNNGVQVQPIGDIYYFILLERNKVQTTTISGKYYVKENLSQIFGKLNDERFYMSHRSCIVNLRYVQSINRNNGIIMTNGDWVPLAQKKQKDFFLRLSQQLRK